MRGFLVSLGIHAAGVLGLVVVPSFSASELPPLPPQRHDVHVPLVPRVGLASVKPPRARRGTSSGGGGGVTGPVRHVDHPPLVSDDPLQKGIEEPQGDPDLPSGPPGFAGFELAPRPPVAAQASPRLVRADIDVQPPRKLAGANPAYPQLAQVTRAEGTVVLECTIGTDGHVRDVRITRSHPLFDAAAVEAVLTWRYTPTLLNGAPVSVLMTVTVVFRLNR